ncbi:MAG: hypothetical protein HUU47_06365 [Bacteroidetes bacterium]|nr:hypothetical protein [Bacteroidota bacterium]
MLFINLIDVIPDLLYKHNCVIIPDFGGFITNFKRSGFEESRNLINPSSKKVAFNQSLIENDGLLVNYWSKAKNISYQSALEDINKFSLYLKEKINENKSFDFKNIGTFYLTTENTILFVPYQGLNFLESSYGLFPVKIKSLNNVIVSTFTAENHENTDEETLINEFEIKTDNAEFEYKLPSLNLSIKPILNVASLVLVAILLIFGVYYFSAEKSKNKTEQKAQLFNIDTNSKKEEKVRKTTIEKLEFNAERKKIGELKAKLKQINQQQQTSNETYDVIVGYYNNQKEADKILIKLKSEFLNARLNEKTEKGYSITVETFYTHNTAKGFSVILKQNGYKNINIEKNIVFD